MRSNKEVDWDKMKNQLVWSEEENQSVVRERLWSKVNKDKEGRATLAEIDNKLKEVLLCYDIKDCKKIVVRAFVLAYNREKKTGRGKEFYVGKEGFRLMLVYLRIYFEFIEAFQKKGWEDGGWVSKEEFLKKVGRVEKWTGPMREAEKVFNKIGGEKDIRFNDLCDWVACKSFEYQDNSK